MLVSRYYRIHMDIDVSKRYFGHLLCNFNFLSGSQCSSQCEDPIAQHVTKRYKLTNVILATDTHAI